MTYKNFALDLAKRAGKVIRQNFRLGMRRQWKADSSEVTVTDLAINKMVIEFVNKHFPSHSVLGEEQSSMKEGAEYVWVCDPVDGTMPFSHGCPTCVFSLTLVQNGKPILGVLYDALLDRLVFAEKNKGTWLNGKKVKAPQTRGGGKSIIGIPAWLSPYVDPGKLLNNLLSHKFAVVDCGSTSYMGMLTALGEFSGVVFSYKNAHDGAAIKILVEEAGGKVTDLYGKEQRYDRPLKGFVATNGIPHKKLLQIVKSSLKKIHS